MRATERGQGEEGILNTARGSLSHTIVFLTTGNIGQSDNGVYCVQYREICGQLPYRWAPKHLSVSFSSFSMSVERKLKQYPLHAL